MHNEPIWSPSEAREAIRADLAALRQSGRAAEQFLVDALRDDVTVNSFEAFKDLAEQFVLAYVQPRRIPDGGRLERLTADTPMTAEQHAVEAAACRARASEWSTIAEKAERDKDEALALLATKAATEADRSADHHAECARALGGVP